MQISIIIPTLNEASNIEALIHRLAGIPGEREIIVVDGGSDDDTVARAETGARVIVSAPGRAVQMNRGARAAEGEILWFIHADCDPHPDSAGAMRAALSDPELLGGGFEYGFDAPERFFRLAEFFSNRKNRLLGLLYGDMGIFVRREVFEAMGGYRELPLMEDVDFSERLKKRGRIVILPPRINTSARRWREEGIVRYTMRIWLIQTAWNLGVGPDRLARWYRAGNGAPLDRNRI